MLSQLGLEPQSDTRSRVALDREQVDRCFAAFNNRPEIRACVNSIRQRLLSRGVEISRSGMKMDADFQAHVRREYGRFCDDVITQACVVGVVPYILRKDPKGLNYPKVLSAQEFDVEVVTDKRGNVTYGIKNDKTAKALFLVFNPPVPTTGTLTSRTASLLTASDYLFSQEVNSFIASEVATRPPLFIRADQVGMVSSDVAHLDNYGAGVVAQHEMNTQLMRNRIQVRCARL